MSRSLILFAAVVFMAGCSLERPYPDKSLYAFSSLEVSEDGAGALGSETIRVLRARVAAPYSTRSFQYRVGESEYEPDYYHAWADDPAELVTAAMLGGLRDSRVFLGVLDASASVRGTMTLDLFVERLYVDVRGAGRAVAVLRVNATGMGADGSMMFTGSYTGDTDASSSRAEDVVEAWGRGLARIVGEIVSDIRRTR